MKKLCLHIALICCLALFISSVSAAEQDIPTLFAGDEAWYKDEVSPLVIRDGVNFIPAELCSMFDYISVTTPTDNNLLIHNTNTGEYISVLFNRQSAAVNGTIVENTPVFRDSGMFYIDAQLAANAVGLELEIYESDNETVSLRLSDENRIFTIAELISAYLPEIDTSLDENELTDIADEEEVPSYAGKLKRIYVLCKSPVEGAYFHAQENCELYGIGYTWFLDADNDSGDILSALADGEYGVTAESESSIAEALDQLNDSISEYTRRKTRLTLTTGDDEQDRMLSEAGYIPIVPDFVVNGASQPDTLLVDIINYIGVAGSCTLYLEDCWNSERMVILLSEINNELYRTANLSDVSLETSN